jgi:hypothetical protein
LYEYLLASIIWHEMAHVDGAGERAARRAEEQLWTRFVRDGIFDPVTALRYLRALANRPDDQMPAADPSGRCSLAGLGENPPLPGEISFRILQRCSP